MGRLLKINGVPHTVVGVMPDGFDYPLGSRAWLLSPRPVPLPPLDVEGDLLAQRDVRYFLAVGRLKVGASLEQASAEFNAIATDLRSSLANRTGLAVSQSSACTTGSSATCARRSWFFLLPLGSCC